MHYARLTPENWCLRFPSLEQAERFRVAYPDRVLLTPTEPLDQRGYWAPPYIGEREDLALIVKLGGHRLFIVPTQLDHEVPY